MLLPAALAAVRRLALGPTLRLIVHSYAGPPAEMRVALDLIAARRVDVASMVTHRLPLAEAGVGFQLMTRASDSLKVIVLPQA